MSTEETPPPSDDSSSEGKKRPELKAVTAADARLTPQTSEVEEEDLDSRNLPGNQRGDALDEMHASTSQKRRRRFGKKILPAPTAQRDSRISQIMQTMEDGLKEIDVHESLKIKPGPRDQRINQILTIMEKGLENIDVRSSLDDDFK